MTVTGERPPAYQTLLTLIESEARGTVQKAKKVVVPIVASEVPRRSGKTALALRPRISQTSTGQALSVRVPRGKRHGSHGYATLAQVVRWVNRGTGLYRAGPGPKARIQGKRQGFRRGNLTLPGGKTVRSVKGQKPNPFVGRIRRRATPLVEAVMIEGARELAKKLERAID